MDCGVCAEEGTGYDDDAVSDICSDGAGSTKGASAGGDDKADCTTGDGGKADEGNGAGAIPDVDVGTGASRREGLIDEAAGTIEGETAEPLKVAT